MKRRIYMGNQCKNQRGFSLIELAIVIVISGILFSMMVAGYKQYSEKKRIYSTQAKIETLVNAMERFYSAYSHYPCPASFSAKPGDSNFGISTDCYNTAIAAATCGDESGNGQTDYCVAEVMRDVDGDGTLDGPFRIRKGSVPFQTLKEGIGWDVDETAFVGPLPFGLPAGSTAKKYQRTFDVGGGDSIDSYKNRFTYVLTEVQGTVDFIPSLGAIQMVDEYGASLSDNVDYIFVSHGSDGQGARSAYGEAIGGGCAGLSANEAENCGNDHTYRSSLRYDKQGALKYDDIVSYRTPKNIYLWDQPKNDETKIYNLNTGNVGVGTTDPQEKMHVSKGNILADSDAILRDPITNNIIEPAGTVMATEYCGYDASGAVTGGIDCFLPEKIGSPIGMDCDRGGGLGGDDFDSTATPHPLKVMEGIQNEKLHCRKLYTSDQDTGNCPVGTFLQGFTYNFTTKTLTRTTCR